MHTYRTHPYRYPAAKPGAASVAPCYRRARKLPPAGAPLGFESRAAVSGRPGVRALRVHRHHPHRATGRPSWSRLPSRALSKRRRRTPSSWPISSLQPQPRLVTSSGCAACAPPSAASISFTDSRPPTRSAYWTGWLGRPGSTPGGAEFSRRQNYTENKVFLRFKLTSQTPNTLHTLFLSFTGRVWCSIRVTDFIRPPLSKILYFKDYIKLGYLTLFSYRPQVLSTRFDSGGRIQATVRAAVVD